MQKKKYQYFQTLLEKFKTLHIVREQPFQYELINESMQMLETLLNGEGRAMGEYGEWEKRGKRSGEGMGRKEKWEKRRNKKD